MHSILQEGRNTAESGGRIGSGSFPPRLTTSLAALAATMTSRLAL